MKTPATWLCLLLAGLGANAGTTIDPGNEYAYGANLGWINAHANGANGAIIGEYVCSGYLYAANTGWINLGNGSPANGIYYQNLSADGFRRQPGRLGQLARLRLGRQHRLAQL